jgi:hypothetical protein
MDIHNLDINMYSFKDILDLFKINEKNLTVEEVKKAKKTVLMMHPDKSRLDSKYFLFFKKAFEVLYHYYDSNLKQNVDLDIVNTDYQDYHDNENNDEISKQVSKIEKKEFNNKFNKLFEENANIKKVDPDRNTWFKEDHPNIDEMEKVVNVSGMNSAINKFKKRNSELIIHRGIRDMTSSNGSNLYEEEDTNDYVGSNIFDKLKYDDLRKVHKDETVFSVSENDITKVKQYRNVDEYKNTRGNQSLDPLSEHESNKLLNNRYENHVENIRKHEQNSIMQTIKNEENNKKFMANFLRLTND